MTHSLEGQAIELAWIRDNRRAGLHADVPEESWYSFIYPMRVGALVASAGQLSEDQFCCLGWYFGRSKYKPTFST
jgi:geranylgeranyl diphosphate synthase type II